MEVAEPSLLIRIPRLYREGMSARELYDATRGVWKLGRRREGAQLALAVESGAVREVYEIHEWHPAGSTNIRSSGRPIFSGDCLTIASEGSESHA